MTPLIEHKQVEANGISFHVAVTGPVGGTPILCLHGYPEGWLSWQNVAAALPNARVYMPDLRGYPDSSRQESGYDVFTLTEDVKGLIEALVISRPLIVGDDWGGELGWIFAHRWSQLIRGLVAINAPHPKTLLRAAFRFEDFQILRLPWVPLFQLPWLPEHFLTSAPGRLLLSRLCRLSEGRKGRMDLGLLEKMLARFRTAQDMRGPVNYYRAFIRTLLHPQSRAQLEGIYLVPITVPVTLVWGEKDKALSARVGRRSGRDAGCEVDWRPLSGVGHFVSLEAPGELARELDRALSQGPS